MQRDHPVDLRGFVIVEPAPSGAQQNGFTPEAEREDFTNQRVGVQHRFGGLRIGTRQSGDKPRKVVMQRRDDLLVNQLIRGRRGELLAGDKFAHAQRLVGSHQLDHLAAGVVNQRAHRGGRRLGLAEQRFGSIGVG